MTNPDSQRRFDKILKAMVEGEAPKGRKSLHEETANPLPQKDYTSKQQPFCDDEENDPEIDGR